MDPKIVKYWNDNIEAFGQAYVTGSSQERRIHANPVVNGLYVTFLLPFDNRTLQKRVAWADENLIPFLRASRDPHVIDFGCGTGRFTIECLKAGARVTAMDAAETAVAITRRNVEQLGEPLTGRASFAVIDSDTVQFPENDLTLALSSLIYVAEWRDVLRRMLRSTNAIAFNHCDRYGIFNVIRQAIPTFNFRKIIYSSFREMLEILAAEGFTIRAKAYIGGGYYMLATRKSGVRVGSPA